MPINFGRKSGSGGSSGGGSGGGSSSSITDTTLYKGAFDTDTDYAVGDIVEDNSKFFIAISVVDHSVGDHYPDSASGTEWLLLTGDVSYRGAWSDDGEVYSASQIVTHDDVVYLTLTHHRKDSGDSAPAADTTNYLALGGGGGGASAEIATAIAAHLANANHPDASTVGSAPVFVEYVIPNNTLIATSTGTWRNVGSGVTNLPSYTNGQAFNNAGDDVSRAGDLITLQPGHWLITVSVPDDGVVNAGNVRKTVGFRLRNAANSANLHEPPVTIYHRGINTSINNVSFAMMQLHLTTETRMRLQSAAVYAETADNMFSNGSGHIRFTKLVVGPAGRDGTNGTNGADGQDGQDGQDGAPGADGQDGADGAAALSNDTPLAPTASGSAGTSPEGSRKDHQHPEQTITSSGGDAANNLAFIDIGDLTGDRTLHIRDVGESFGEPHAPIGTLHDRTVILTGSAEGGITVEVHLDNGTDRFDGTAFALINATDQPITIVEYSLPPATEEGIFNGIIPPTSVSYWEFTRSSATEIGVNIHHTVDTSASSFYILHDPLESQHIRSPRADMYLAFEAFIPHASETRYGLHLDITDAVDPILGTTLGTKVSEAVTTAGGAQRLRYALQPTDFTGRANGDVVRYAIVQGSTKLHEGTFVYHTTASSDQSLDGRYNEMRNLIFSSDTVIQFATNAYTWKLVDANLTLPLVGKLLLQFPKSASGALIGGAEISAWADDIFKYPARADGELAWSSYVQDGTTYRAVHGHQTDIPRSAYMATSGPPGGSRTIVLGHDSSGRLLMAPDLASVALPAIRVYQLL